MLYNNNPTFVFCISSGRRQKAFVCKIIFDLKLAPTLHSLFRWGGGKTSDCVLCELFLSFVIMFHFIIRNGIFSILMNSVLVLSIICQFIKKKMKVDQNVPTLRLMNNICVDSIPPPELINISIHNDETILFSLDFIQEETRMRPRVTPIIIIIIIDCL